jgi:hypothetical protein
MVTHTTGGLLAFGIGIPVAPQAPPAPHRRHLSKRSRRASKIHARVFPPFFVCLDVSHQGEHFKNAKKIVVTESRSVCF